MSLGKYFKCFAVYLLQYLLANVSCNLFYEVFNFFMIIPPFLKSLFIGGFFCDELSCLWQHDLLYVFTGSKSYFISAQALACCRQDIKVAFCTTWLTKQKLTWKIFTSVRHTVYCTGFFNSHEQGMFLRYVGVLRGIIIVIYCYFHHENIYIFFSYY